MNPHQHPGDMPAVDWRPANPPGRRTVAELDQGVANYHQLGIDSHKLGFAASVLAGLRVRLAAELPETATRDDVLRHLALVWVGQIELQAAMLEVEGNEKAELYDLAVRSHHDAASHLRGHVSDTLGELGLLNGDDE